MNTLIKHLFVTVCLAAITHRGLAQGPLDPTFNTGIGAEDSVQTLAIQPDGRIIAAGLFFNINNAANSLGIARLLTNGAVDATFNPGTSVDFGISSVAVHADGKIMLGGGFTTYQGASRNGLARIHTNGTRDDAFNPGTGVNDIINSVALQPDGKVLIAGAFTFYNGTPRSGLARVNTNGTLDATFNPGTGVNFAAQSVFVQPDGKILLAGGFATYNGVQRRGVARINSDGSRDDTFDPGVGANGLVRVALAQPDGKVLIGGDFTTFGGQSRNRIARLNTNGTLDVTFNPGTGTSSAVYALALQPNGKIVLGGTFTTFNGIGRNRVARLLPNGALDPNFNPGTGASSTVQALALQPDGKVLLGGSFSTFNGSSQVRLARLLGRDPQSSPRLAAPTPSGVNATLAWSSISNGIYRVEYKTDVAVTNWNTFPTNIISTSTNTSVTDELGAVLQRYYRVALLP